MEIKIIHLYIYITLNLDKQKKKKNVRFNNRCSSLHNNSFQKYKLLKTRWPLGRTLESNVVL